MPASLGWLEPDPREGVRDAMGPYFRRPVDRFVVQDERRFVEYAVWNTLHDGSITSVEGRVPGDVTFTVDIPYLCGELPTSAKHLVVRLRQCTRFEYRPFEGEPVIILNDLRSRDIEVLSAEPEGDGVSVVCVDGFLKLAYGEVEAQLAEGAPVSQEELEAAAERYWSKWAERNARE